MDKQPISKHLLSKSTFMYGVQCDLKFFLNKFNPELRNPEDEQQESIFSSGTNIGLLARDLFPGGISAEPANPFSYHLSVEKTSKLIKQQHDIIYEAAFSFEGVLCAIDILVKKGNKWYAFEVKGSTNLKGKEHYIMDASLQHFVITNSGLPLDDISIVHLNNQYVRKGRLDVQKLFACLSILDQVNENKDFVEKKILELKRLLIDKKKPEIEVGGQCFKPYECNFTNHCWANIKEEKVVGENNYDIDSIKEYLQEWEYPLYYFDFETIMPAVPEFDDSRPYQQIPFQFSLHVQKSKNTDIEHYEFLGNGTSDPREELIKDLLNKVGKRGSIVTWNQTFEKSRLKELARDFPKYEKELNYIIERVVDLMVPFRKKWYNLPGFNGSYSIKAVLPVLIPELSYSMLDIKEGGTASLVYSELKNQTPEIQLQQRKQLLEYCKLDTLAMVKILEQLERFNY